MYRATIGGESGVVKECLITPGNQDGMLPLVREDSLPFVSDEHQPCQVWNTTLVKGGISPLTSESFGAMVATPKNIL